MTKFTDSDLSRLAELARLEVSTQRKAETSSQLVKVLDFVDQLQAVDTTGVEPTSQITGLVDVLRPDVVKPSSISRAELLKRAPQTEGNYIKVNRVLK